MDFLARPSAEDGAGQAYTVTVLTPRVRPLDHLTEASVFLIVMGAHIIGVYNG